MYLDLSKITAPRSDGSEYDLRQKYWKSIVSEKIGKKSCHFTATKKEIPEQICQWPNVMKIRGLKVKIIRLNPVEDNVAL